MLDVSTILLSVGGSGALTWLVRNWISERLKNAIKHEYDQKLVAFQAQLKAESDIKLEQLKAQLQIAAAERSIRLTRVFEHTAKVIATTYAKLVTYKQALAVYIQIYEAPDAMPKAERRKIVQEKHFDLLEYFQLNRIYFPEQTAQQVQAMIDKLLYLAIQFMNDVENEENREHGRPDKKTWLSVVTELNNGIPPLLQSLEADFRKILGMDESESPPSGG